MAYLMYVVGCPYGNLLQYSCLAKPMDQGAWWATVHRVIKSRTPTEHSHIFHIARRPG